MDERRGLDCPRVQITQMSAVHPEDGRACVAAAARTVLRAAEQFCAVELTARVRLFSVCAHCFLLSSSSTAGGQRNGIFLEYTQKNNGADVIVSYCKEHGKRWGKKRGVKSR